MPCQLLIQRSQTPSHRIHFISSLILFRTKPLTPNTFATHILHRKPFTAETLHTSSLLHFWTRPSCKENFLRQKAFAPEVFTTNTSCTKFLLHLALRDLLYIHQKPSTPAAHLKHFTPNNFLHRIFLHQEPFTADPFYTKQACKNNPAQPKFSTPFQLISFTPQDFCIHLHQAILTPKNP